MTGKLHSSTSCFGLEGTLFALKEMLRKFCHNKQQAGRHVVVLRPRGHRDHDTAALHFGTELKQILLSGLCAPLSFSDTPVPIKLVFRPGSREFYTILTASLMVADQVATVASCARDETRSGINYHNRGQTSLPTMCILISLIIRASPLQ